jgi:hypothetical protein
VIEPLAALTSFFLSLGIYLWLAETSQQPINQTTWLKVTPHCNHSPLVAHNRQTLTTDFNHRLLLAQQSAADQQNNLAEGHPPL